MEDIGKKRARALKWARKHRAYNREAVRVKNRADYAKNREKRLASAKAYGHRHAVRISERRKAQRPAWRASQYGLTLDELKAMEAAQEGRCAICDELPAGAVGQTNKLHIDHCHATKRVRELLCHSCNVALGQFKESPALLRKAAMYLERHAKSELTVDGKLPALERPDGD